MSQSLVQCYLHVIYSTKHREPFLQDKSIRNAMHAYLAGICQNLGSPSLLIGGVEDHVHILCRFSKKITIMDFLRDTKRDSSKWIKTQGTQYSSFHWQEGYGAFSISPSHVPQVKEYIAHQEEHHKEESFQDEMRRIFRKYEIEFDERYVGE